MRKLLISILLLSLIFSVPAWCQTEIDGRQIRTNSINADRIIGGITSPNAIVQLEAAENLTAGDVCSIISSGGTQKAIKNNLAVNPTPNGAESVFNSAASTYISCCQLDSTRFLVAYVDSDTYPKAIVGTVTGSTIAWGNEAIIRGANSSYLSVAKINTDKVLVCYSNDAGQVGMNVLTISTLSITVGAYAQAYGGAEAEYISSTTLETDKVLVCYKNKTSAYGKCKVITISNTTPTPYPNQNNDGTEFNAAATAYISVSALDSGNALVCYSDGGDSNYGHAQVLSISGTTITPGTEYTFKSAATTYTSISAISSTTAVICYKSTNGYAVHATNNAGTISFGTESASFNDGDYNSIAKINDSTFIISSQIAAVNQGQTIIGNISSTNISFNTASTFNTGTSNYISTCYLGNYKSAVCYSDNDNSAYGTSVINAYATVSYDSVAGISQGSYSSGATASVLIKGVDTHQTGLIFPTTYWLQSDMSIGTLPVSLGGSYIRLGISKSATELIMD